jgi:hypothetical protein
VDLHYFKVIIFSDPKALLLLAKQQMRGFITSFPWAGCPTSWYRGRRLKIVIATPRFFWEN